MPGEVTSATCTHTTWGDGRWSHTQHLDEAVLTPTALSSPRTRLRGPMSLLTHRPEEQDAAGEGKLLWD